MNGTRTISPPLRILLVEDHEDTLHSLGLYLKCAGYLVFTARNKAEALQQLPEVDCDILLCDINLPDGSGWDLLKEAQISKKAYAIAMSGYGRQADFERSVASGFRHHLVKPIRPDKLDSLLAKASTELLEQMPK